MANLVLTLFLGISILVAIAAHAMAQRKRRTTLWGFATLICVPAIFILLALPARGDGRRRVGAIEIAGLVAATAVTGLFVASTIAAQFDWAMPANPAATD